MSTNSEKSGSLSVGYERKEQMRCMLCGGRECTKCGLDAYKKVASPALEYLHSHWITDKIVGMQRPNESSLLNGALEDMKKKKITAIFNLTEPGEHPFCGCGNLTESGFPYHPETVMSHGIKHFNFNWRDMTVPTLDMMDQIVFIACNEIQNGGKIALHCHAGFGRTGLAIACILIAVDHLSAESVITFVRNRRPGSIQTTAQQQFIHRYEKHRNLMMQVFPTYEEIEEGRMGSSKTKSFVAYPKTIAISVEDQRHFLLRADQHNADFRYVHKVVRICSQAISRLAFDQFYVACLAITGLNKLSVKRNSVDAGRETDAYAARVENLPQATRPQLLRKKSSFMVATNSLSESSEESMLTEIKLELNQNNSTRMMSLSDVISADFRARGESFSKLEARVLQDIRDEQAQTDLEIRNSPTHHHHHHHHHQHQQQHGHNNSHGGVEGLSMHQHQHQHLHNPDDRHSPHHLIHTPTKASRDLDDLDEGNEEETAAVNVHTAVKLTQQDPNASESIGIPFTHSNSDIPRHALEVEKKRSSPTSLNKVDEAILVPHSTSSFKSLSRSKLSLNPVDEQDPHVASISRATSAAMGNNDQSTNVRHSFIGLKERQPTVPRMVLPSPLSLIRGLSAKSLNNDNSQSNVSGNNTQRSVASNSSVTSPLTVIRANSLRQNTEQDYAKSKKMAANLLSQLLLDWLETRSDAIFTATDVDLLQDIWAKHGGIPKVVEEKLEEDGGSSRSTSDRGTTTAVPVASSPNDINDDFYNDDLIHAIFQHLVEHFSRFKLELLSAIIDMYRLLRLAGFEYTVKQRAKAQDHSSAAQSPTNNSHSNSAFGHPGDSSSAGTAGSETQALDALVGLRLTIACMHARKKNSSLVRRRGLVIDLVKVFLLKSSSSEFVIINNITFSAENFAQIQHNVGVVLLGQIDIIFRTLNLLVDTHWSSSYKKVRGRHRERVVDANRVGWKDSHLSQGIRDGA